MKTSSLLFPLLPAVWGAVVPLTSRSEHSSYTSKHNFSTYAPVSIQCPARRQWVRPAIGLSEEETAWVQGRKQKVLNGLESYLKRLHLRDFDVDEYLNHLSHDSEMVPTIGMAISGGAWASSLTGTGALRAFDARFEPAVKERTGGILQSMTYLSGLSGGSWPLISLSTYNFPTIDEMVSNWRLDVDPIAPPNNTAHRATPERILEQVAAKFEAGYNVSFADYLGRDFGYQFVAGPNGGLATMISDIAKLSNFVNHEMPLPMWQVAESTSDDVEFFGIKVPYYNATLYEWSPFEFGAWGGPKAFFPIKYLGTKMADGVPVGDCVVGFERASFMLGMAADAVNFWWVESLSNGTLASFSKRHQQIASSSLQRRSGTPMFPIAPIKSLAAEFKKLFGYTLTEAMYLTTPNPFASKDSISNDVNPPQNLTLLDESEAGQSLPLWSQIQPARKSDFIIAWDNDEDAHPYNWQNGTNLYNSYIYATNASVPFPVIPPPATFINRNMTSGPTFFGCDARQTNTNTTQAPIILYLPNAPYSSYTNYSDFQSVFSNEEMAVILTNGFNYLTQGNGTLDAEWPECLGCAAIERSLARVGMTRTEQCSRCFERYCWDGVEDNADPGLVDLPLKLDPSWTFDEWNKSSPQQGGFWGETPKNGSGKTYATEG